MRKRATPAEDDETLYYNTKVQENEVTSALITTKNSSSSSSSNNNNNNMPAARFQPMSISMGKDYESTLQQRRESSHRKTIVAILLTSVSLVFSWIVLGARKATVAHQTTSICRSYNAAYFKRLALQISSERTTQDESHLCVTTVVTNHSQCRCHNPFVPQQQESSKVVSVDQWMDILQMNAALIQKNYSILDNGGHHRQPDVLLYGDSITERLLGRFFGRYGPKMQEYARVTEQLLTKAGGGQMDGLPLGISSDEIAHLLYRMQNGELPEFMHPQVWWILIGTNDMAAGCSGDVIVAGVIRIIQEIRQHLHHHHARRGETGKHAPIVINSILPRSPRNLLGDNNNNPHWKISRDVNLRLSCYAAVSTDIYFANATDIFVQEETKESTGRDGIFINPGMFEKDSLHPSVEGSRRWEEFIVAKTLELLAAS